MIKGLFFTSDWHIGHSKVIEFDGRPFKNVDHMHEVLINNYNSVVTKETDICYFLGDIGLTKGDQIKKVISKLNGKKICILGNHDRNRSFMIDQGFYDALNMASFAIGNSIVTMTHCPLRKIHRESVPNQREGDAWHGEHKHEKFSIPDFGQFHLHGHIHSTPFNGKNKIEGRQYDVGVAANNYRPVSISQIESWIAKYNKKTKND